jgi:hypothetical protein
MIVLDCPQLSEEWFAARLGNPGASNFSKIVTTKGDPSKQQQDYMYQLAGELVSRQAEVNFASPWMERGTQLEQEARDLYSLVNNTDVEQCGLVYFDDRKDRHCSPDGLLSNPGAGYIRGVEIKCPMQKTHVSYLVNGGLPSDYFQQVQGSLYICGFDTWDFVSYSPGLPLFQVTVERDEAFCRKLHGALDDFVARLFLTVEKIKAMQ